MPIVSIQAEQGTDVASAKQFTGGGGLIPEGVYQITINEMPENGAPKSADKHAWTKVAGVVANCLQTLDPAQKGVSSIGRKTNNLFSHSPKSVGAMKALCEAAGVQYRIVQYQGGVQGIEFDTDHLMGRSIEAKIIHEDDNRPDSQYPKQVRWVDLQPVGTFARTGGVQQSAQPGHVPGVPQGAPQQAFVPQQAPFVPQAAPGGYPSHAPQQAPAQAAPQQYPAAQGYPQTQGFAPPPVGGQPPPQGYVQR